MTASEHAINASSHVETDDTVFWLEPHSARQPRPSTNAHWRHWFLGFTLSVGVGTVGLMASAGSTTRPAWAHTRETALEMRPVATKGQPLARHAMLEPNLQPAPAEPPRDEEPSWNTATDDLLAEHRADSQRSEERTERDPNEILQFETMRVPRWIVETIVRAAAATGVDPAYMMALADKESSFIPGNKARTSSAEGLFQFVANTWLEVVHEFGAQYGLFDEAAAIQNVGGQWTLTDESMRERVLGLRRDPYLSALMAAEMLKRDRARIERRIGRSLTRAELYLAHFLGVRSAGRFMEMVDEKPKQSAPRVFPDAARANKTLFYAKKGRKTRHLSVAEVYDKIDQMIDRRLDRYEGVAAITAVDATF